MTVNAHPCATRTGRLADAPRTLHRATRIGLLPDTARAPHRIVGTADVPRPLHRATRIGLLALVVRKHHNTGPIVGRSTTQVRAAR